MLAGEHGLTAAFDPMPELNALRTVMHRASLAHYVQPLTRCTPQAGTLLLTGSPCLPWSVRVQY